MLKLFFYSIVLFMSCSHVYSQNKVKIQWPNGKLKEKYTEEGGYLIGSYKSFYANGEVMSSGKYKKSKVGFNEGNEHGFYVNKQKKYTYQINGITGNEEAIIFDSLGNEIRKVTVIRSDDKKNKNSIVIVSEAKYTNGEIKTTDEFNLNTFNRFCKEYYPSGKIKREISMFPKDASIRYDLNYRTNLLKKLGYLNINSEQSQLTFRASLQSLNLGEKPEFIFNEISYYENGNQRYREDFEPYMLTIKQHYKQWFNDFGKPVLDSVWVADTLHRVWKHYYMLEDTFWIYSTLYHKKDSFNFMNTNGPKKYLERAQIENKENSVSLLYRNLITDSLKSCYAKINNEMNKYFEKKYEKNKEAVYENRIYSTYTFMEFAELNVPRYLPTFLPDGIYYSAKAYKKIYHPNYKRIEFNHFPKGDEKSHSKKGLLDVGDQPDYYKYFDKLIVGEKYIYQNKILKTLIHYHQADTIISGGTTLYPCDWRTQQKAICETDPKAYYCIRDTHSDLYGAEGFYFKKDTNSFLMFDETKRLNISEYSPKYFTPIFKYSMPTPYNNMKGDTTHFLLDDSIFILKSYHNNEAHKLWTNRVINLKKGTLHYTEYYSLSNSKRVEYSSKIDLRFLKNCSIHEPQFLPWEDDGVSKLYSHDGGVYEESVFKKGKLIRKKTNNKHKKFCATCPDYY